MRLTIKSSIKSCEYEDEAEGAGRMTTDGGERRWRGGLRCSDVTSRRAAERCAKKTKAAPRRLDQSADYRGRSVYAQPTALSGFTEHLHGGKLRVLFLFLFSLSSASAGS